LEAEIVIEYDDAAVSESIAEAVSPDNIATLRKLSVRTINDRKKVISVVKCYEGFRTFIATIDDLLFSIATAEKILRGL
jgi:hypothetical protein